MAVRLSTSTTQPPMPRAAVYRACLAGHLPAEVLDTVEFERLIRELWTEGWTDIAIAAHTRTTTYTTGRIRYRLGLPPRPPLIHAVA